jgi:hypothetical protein
MFFVHLGYIQKAKKNCAVFYRYITQGIPVVLLSHLVPFGIGIYYLEKSRQKWLLLIGIDVAVFRLVVLY